MSDILAMLVQRERGLAQALAPRLPSRFESGAEPVPPVDAPAAAANASAPTVAGSGPVPPSPPSHGRQSAPMAAPAPIAPPRAAIATHSFAPSTQAPTGHAAPMPPRERAGPVQPAVAIVHHTVVQAAPAAAPAVSPAPAPAAAAAPAPRRAPDPVPLRAGAAPASARAPAPAPSMPAAAVPAPVRVSVALSSTPAAARGAQPAQALGPPPAALLQAPRSAPSAAPDPVPAIHVSIGRVEVRAVSAASQTARGPRQPEPTSLETYLGRRNGRERQ
jgi:hypothetical protein